MQYFQFKDLKISSTLLPFRQLRFLHAVLLILDSHLFHLFLEPALTEHQIGLGLVEGAAHSSISRLHAEDCGATDLLSFPSALLYHTHACELIFSELESSQYSMTLTLFLLRLGSDVQDVKAGNFRVPKQLKERGVTLIQVNGGKGVPEWISAAKLPFLH